MELNEKLLELRKYKGLTQEELAEALYVSRTAISKWESGRGVPNIESLKAISLYFATSVDDLLSGEELLLIAEEDRKQGQNHTRDLLFGLVDCGALLLFLLPLFGQTVNGQIQEVSLLQLNHLQPWLRNIYLVFAVAIAVVGILTLALQNYSGKFWCGSKVLISLICNVIAVCLFIISRQPYAAVYLFMFLFIKCLLLLKQR